MKKRFFILAVVALLISNTAMFANDFSFKDFLGKTTISDALTIRSSGWKVTCGNVNLREHPSTSATIVCVLSEGTTLNGGREDYAYDSNGNLWYQVQVTSGAHAGEFGWISASCITEVS